MNLRHATPLANVDRIFDEGLDPMYAVTDSDRKYIWLHTPGKDAVGISAHQPPQTGAESGDRHS